MSQSHSFSLVRSFFPIHELSLCALRLIFCHTETKTEETEEQDRRICWACALMFLTPQWLLYVGLPPVQHLKKIRISLTYFIYVFPVILRTSSSYLPHKLNGHCKGDAVCSL